MTLCLLKGQQHPEIESNVAAELPLNVHFDAINHFFGPATTQGRLKVCKKKYKKYVHKMQHSSPWGAWQDLFQNLSYSLQMRKHK